jgi:hypothetical protein
MPPSKPAARKSTVPAAAHAPPARSGLPVLELTQARARWHARQGLAAPSSAPLAEVIGASSWPRTLGGIDVYLAVAARVPRLRQRDLDAAVEGGDLRVVPAVRGCMHLVPRALVPLCLRVAEDQWRPRTDRELPKAGTSWTEIDEVAAAACQALARGPLTTDALRRAMPAGSVRSLGDAGKKVGISSPLPLALRVLEFRGAIERTLPGGRLDSERYEWRLAAAGLPGDPAVPATDDERNARLAAIFFAGSAPATVKDFAAWAGLGQREARAALAALPLQPVQVPGYADEALAFAADLEAAPPSTRVALLPFEDHYLTAHGGLSRLTDPAHYERAVPVWGSSRTSTLGDAKYVGLRPVLCGPEVIGFWEYDPDGQRVVTSSFDPPARAVAAALREAGEALTALLRDELAHGRSFNLDTDDDLRRRTAFVQQLAG